MGFFKKFQRKSRCKKTNSVSPMDVRTLTTEESQPGTSAAREAACLHEPDPAEVYTRYLQQLSSKKIVKVPYTEWIKREATRLHEPDSAEVYTRYFKLLPSSKLVEVPYTSWNHPEATCLDELDPAVKITYYFKQLSSSKFVEVMYKSWKKQEAAGLDEPDPTVVRIEFFKQLSSSECVQVPYTSRNHCLFEERSQVARQVFVHSSKDCQCSSLTLEGATTKCPFAAVEGEENVATSSL